MVMLRSSSFLKRTVCAQRRRERRSCWTQAAAAKAGWLARRGAQLSAGQHRHGCSRRGEAARGESTGRREGLPTRLHPRDGLHHRALPVRHVTDRANVDGGLSADNLGRERGELGHLRREGARRRVSAAGWPGREQAAAAAAAAAAAVTAKRARALTSSVARSCSIKPTGPRLAAAMFLPQAGEEEPSLAAPLLLQHNKRH